WVQYLLGILHSRSSDKVGSIFTYVHVLARVGNKSSLFYEHVRYRVIWTGLVGVSKTGSSRSETVSYLESLLREALASERSLTRQLKAGKNLAELRDHLGR